MDEREPGPDVMEVVMEVSLEEALEAFGVARPRRREPAVDPALTDTSPALRVPPFRR